MFSSLKCSWPLGKVNLLDPPRSTAETELELCHIFPLYSSNPFASLFHLQCTTQRIENGLYLQPAQAGHSTYWLLCWTRYLILWCNRTEAFRNRLCLSCRPSIGSLHLNKCRKTWYCYFQSLCISLFPNQHNSCQHSCFEFHTLVWSETNRNT